MSAEGSNPVIDEISRRIAYDKSTARSLEGTYLFDDTTPPPEFTVDREVREALFQRLVGGVKKAMNAGKQAHEPPIRSAVATLIGGMIFGRFVMSRPKLPARS